MEKVTVSKEVAEAIGFQLSRRSKSDLLDAKAKHINCGGYFLNSSAVLNDVSLETLAKALYIGYELEKSPEVMVREYYEGLIASEEALESIGNSGAQFRQGWQSVRETLHILGIKIEGVNA